MVTIYPPKGLGDLVFPTTRAKDCCEAFVKGNLDWLLLHGAPGSGKSSAAKTLMKCRIPDLIENFDVIHHNASRDRSIEGLKNAFESLKNCGWNSLDQKVLILEEVDQLASVAADTLKGLLDDCEGIKVPIIMTTNHVNKLDPATCDRMVIIDWPNLTTEKMTQWIENQCVKNSRVLTKAELNQILGEATSFRKAKQALERL
ncbi:AAA family ATPase [Acetobacter orientalis]|uniref:AAA family ATPase n=1 Tax=Acetobacter orientalis TaxID=146474 RepID=UPI00386A40A2